MCKTEKHFAGICTHEEIMQLLEYRNKSDGYLKRVDPDFPRPISKLPYHRKKNYYALKEVYPYVDQINDKYSKKEQLKAAQAKENFERLKQSQPRLILIKLRRIITVHEDFLELEKILRNLQLPERPRSKYRDECLVALKNYMERQTAQRRLRIVQTILNWLDHEEELKRQARR